MRTIHLVSHTHWDREWYQTFQQFRLRLVHLVDQLLDLLKSDPQYRFFMLDGQTIVLEDYLQMRPECESDLRALIQSGRVLIGPWYILPDEFLVSPEATIRNLLEGERIARSFGAKMPVGYLPDTFGHIGQMPQILRGFGIDAACIWRGIKEEPCEFLWQSADGSRVFTANLRESYGNGAGLWTGRPETFLESVRAQCGVLSTHASAPHILLMQGTDHMEPVAATPAAVAYAEGRLDGDTLIHSTLPGYIQAVQSSINTASLPVVAGEFRASMRSPLLPGVLSSRMWIKQRNRACESLLEKWAEPFSAWASVAAADKRLSGALRHPEAILRQAWRLLMQCHPHDSICGCSVDQVHEEMRPRFDQVEQIGEEVTRQSLEVLTDAVDTRPPSGWSPGAYTIVSALVVYNPTTQARTDLVSGVAEAVPVGKAVELVDETGTPAPFELKRLGSKELIRYEMSPLEFRMGLGTISDGNLGGMQVREASVWREGSKGFATFTLSEKGEPDMIAFERSRKAAEELLADPDVTSYLVTARTFENAQIVFSAPQVPGHGYRAFWLRSKTGSGQPDGAMVSDAGQPPYRIENDFFVVEAQPDGSLDVLDKATGTRYPGQNRLVDGGDRGDEYNFSAPTADCLIVAKPVEVRVEKSPVQQALEISLALDVPEELTPDRQSRSKKAVTLAIKSRVTLIAGVPRVDIQTEVDNQARDHRLRVHFAAPFSTDLAQFDGHFEIVQRPLDLPAYDSSWVEQPRPEAPQRVFTAVSDGKHALLVANRGLPESEVLRRADGHAEIAVTLLRCVGWLSRDDFPERRGHAGPGEETPGAQMMGKSVFHYAIIPHPASNSLAAYEQAYAFETPMRAATAGLHSGNLPSRGAFIRVEPAEFTISAVKTAEDGRGWLARGYNLSERDIDVRITPLLPYSSVEWVNLAEQKLEELTIGANGAAERAVKGHQIASVLFHF